MAQSPLYVTRKFPPSVGGMETLAESTWGAVRTVSPDSRLIAHGGSKAWLPLWLPFAVSRTTWMILRRRVDSVLAGDALTFAALWPTLRLTGTPAVVMIMGLDVTFENRLYQAFVGRALRHAPHVVAISRATAAAAIAHGVDSERIEVVRLGVQVPKEAGRHDYRSLLGERWNCGKGPLMVTVGRLVKRKGVRWFVDQVIPRLPAESEYLIAGDGPERGLIEETIARRGLEARVRLVGRVSDHDRELLMRGADLFIQPNVPVPHDMEGFGLVTLEASMRDTPVVAAALEGLQDAVIDGETGWLLPAEEPQAWVDHITGVLAGGFDLNAAGKRFGANARELFSEEAMGAALKSALLNQAPKG